MPRRLVGSRVFGGSSGDKLFLEKARPGLVVVIYQPSPAKLKLSDNYAPPAHAVKAKRKLLEIGGPKGWLSIFPLNTLPTHPDFLQPKYKQIISIALEGFEFHTPSSVRDVTYLMEELPSGFVKDFVFGLGLQKDYRFIIDSVERIPQVKHLVLSQENETGVSGEFYTLNFEEYDAIRRGINRITTKQQSDGATDKRILAHNSLLTSLDAQKFPEKTRPYKKDTIFKLISSEGKGPLPLSVADQNAAIRLVDQNKREIAQKAPQQLLQLRKDIELVTLEALMKKYEGMLTKNLPEGRWQELFNENPFILNLAFGYPVIRIQDQAHVGGRKLSGSGETITDFLVKHRISNNAALFEIKTPGTALLNKKPYRGNLYTPSADLVGAINQMLDQKSKFQREVAMLKENSRISHLESYAVHGVLVVGTTPEDVDRQKSFELFRGNSKDIAIITFDELLEKLRLLHGFLATTEAKADPTSILHRLETAVLRLQDEFGQLYEYASSRSGGYFSGTMKPLPGVDGNAVMRAQGKLSILKSGFERVRLEKPPYPVAWDESGNHTRNVETVEELIAEAEKTIDEAGSVLAEQKKNRGAS
ncbi:MAG TPA: Shedu immune nuclease family protein [Candidatus Angelobacter sp.]|nr:Shedu immune nuclease family protein [Candidatus Angelobacter sp.]